MSEDEKVEVQETTEVTETTETVESKIDTLEEALKEVQKLRREAAGKRVKNKELEEDAKKWKEHLDSQKTELQKLTEERDSATKEAEKLRLDNMRSNVLLKYKVDPELADLVSGNTQEELEAKAKKLSELKATGKQPNFFPGSRGTSVSPQDENLDDWFKRWWKESDNKKSVTFR